MERESEGRIAQFVTVAAPKQAHSAKCVRFRKGGSLAHTQRRFPLVTRSPNITTMIHLRKVPRVSNQLLHYLYRLLELGLVLLRRLDLAMSTSASRRTSVHPLQILAQERNARILSVDILAPRRRLDRDRLEDGVELVYEFGRVAIGGYLFRGRIVQRRGARGTHGRGDL